MAYATTLQLAKFMNIMRTIPDRNLVGESRTEELVGVGNSSATAFYLDYGFVVASSYTIYKGTVVTSLTALTETTDYTLDKEYGKITLTSAGVTSVGTSNIYAKYNYIPADIGFTDAEMSDAIARAEEQIDRFTNNHFAVSTDTTPDWNKTTNEQQFGKGPFRRNYFTLFKYPVPSVSTQLNGAVTAAATTITVDSTAGFPTAGFLLIEDDKIEYTGKSSTTFTGCTSVAAHADDTAVASYVVEISTTEPGGAITWDVLKESTEFEIDKNTGQVHIYADGDNYFGTYVDIESSPLKGVANRFRVSYLSGESSIPDDVVKATLMLASKDLMSRAVRHAHSAGLNDFNPSLLNVDQEELNRVVMNHRNEQYARC